MWRWLEWLVSLTKPIDAFLFGWLKAWASTLPRWIYYPLNWLVAHGGIAYVMLVTGLVIAGQVGAIIGGSAGIVFYVVRELLGWFNPRSTSPWWDHLGDMLGPIVVAVLGMIPSTRWVPLPFILLVLYLAGCFTDRRT